MLSATTNWQMRFDRLKEIIRDRQAFEAKHPYLPYSNHKTYSDFFDERSETLLRYAVRIGNLDVVLDLVSAFERDTESKIKDFEQQESDKVKQVSFKCKIGKKFDDILVVCLRGALIFGHLDISKYLYNKVHDASSISLSDIKDSSCRQWFTDKITEELSISRRTQATLFQPSMFKLFKQGFLFDEDTDTKSLLDRIAEIGDMEYLEIYRNDPEEEFRYKSSINTMLYNAAANNQIEIIRVLISDKASIQPDQLYKRAPFLAAINSNSLAAADFLLKVGININYQGEFKKTALLLAIQNKNLVAVDWLIKNGADILLKDAFGKNALHYAIEADNPNLVMRLLQEPNAYILSDMQDIYGMKAIDYAVENTQTQLVQLLNPNFDLSTLSENAPIIPINQSTIMARMKYYLSSQYRDLDFFSEGGHCNGFSFLRDIYSHRGMEDYFFDTLALMASWDGSQTALEKPFDQALPQADYYYNLQDLFEQWTNDIIWFQHSTLHSLFELNPAYQQQDNRMFQMQMIADSQFPSPRIISYPSQGITNMDCFLENIQIFSERMPKGTRLEISGSEHATSVYINDARQFSYYDSNFKRRARPFSTESEFTEAVIDTKLIAIGKSVENFSVELRFFYYENPTIAKQIAENPVFKEDELPKSKQEANDFQQKSKNGYTHLHVAALTGSVKAIKSIMRSGYCDIDAKDKQNKSALTMAILANNQLVIQTLLDFYPSSKKAPSTHFIEAYYKGKMDIVELMLNNPDHVDLVPLFFAALLNKDYSLIERLLKENLVDVNAEVPNEEGKALTFALIKNDPRTVQLLLKYGASLTEVSPKDTSGWSSPLKNLVESSPEIILAALPFLIDINQKDSHGKALVHYLMYTNNENIGTLFNVLLERGANFNCKSDSGNTPLFEILSNLLLSDEKKTRLVKLLLPHVELDMRDKGIKKEMQALLVNIIKSSDIALLKILLEKFPKAWLNSVNEEGIPALMYALASNDPIIIKALLEAGADPNVISLKSGLTPLHAAVKHNREGSISLLLEYHADVLKPNSEGKTVLDFVEIYGGDKVREIFSDLSFKK